MQPKYLRRRKIPFRLACSILLCPGPAPDRTLQLRQVLPSSDVPLIQRFTTCKKISTKEEKLIRQDSFGNSISKQSILQELKLISI